MKYRKTNRRKYRSKRKTLRKTYRGGRAVSKYQSLHNPCQIYINKLEKIKNKLDEQTEDTISDFYGEVRAFYDELIASGVLNTSCGYILSQIELFENGALKEKMDELLAN